MLVFYKERLVFLSVPKTGSTAYQTALSERADIVVSGPPELKHAPVYRYNRWFRPMFEKVCCAQMEILAVMREPISWLGSWYRYRRRPFLEGKPTSTESIGFDEFVAAYTRGKRPVFADVGSQAKFLETQPNGIGVTHLFRYEDPQPLRAFLQTRLSIEFELPRENVSPQMELTLSKDVERRLRNKCPAEFALYDSIAR